MVDQGKSFSMRKQGHEEVDSENEVDTHDHEQNPRSPNAISPPSITMLHLCHPLSCNVKVQRRGNLMLLMSMGVSLPNAIRPPPHHPNPASSPIFPQF